MDGTAMWTGTAVHEPPIKGRSRLLAGVVAALPVAAPYPAVTVAPLVSAVTAGAAVAVCHLGPALPHIWMASHARR